MYACFLIREPSMPHILKKTQRPMPSMPHILMMMIVYWYLFSNHLKDSESYAEHHDATYTEKDPKSYATHIY
jgi:hypothetical protein